MTRDIAQSAFVAGDHARARSILQDLLERTPDDADLLRRLAAAEAALGNLPGARLAIDRAIALSPDDADIQLARANILLWQGELAAARTQASAVSRTRPGYPGLDTFLEAAEKAAQSRRLHVRAAGLGATLSRAEFAFGETRDWTVQRGFASLGWGRGSIATLSAEREDRGPQDTRLAARVDHPVGEHRVFLAGSVTPSADFREDWSLSAGGDMRLDRSTRLLMDGKFAQYGEDDVGVIGAGVRRQFAEVFSLTGRTIHLFGGGEDYRLGASVRGDYEPGSGPALFVVAASYPDAEVDGTRQLRALAGGGRLRLDDGLVLAMAGEFESREDSYERYALSLDLIWNFSGP